MSDGGCSDPDSNLGVFSLNVTPSEASVGDQTSLRPDVSTRHDQQHNKKASVVDYDDEDEQLNSELQLIFDKNALVGRQSSWSYEKVAVLLIAWDRSCDDLNTNEEVIQSFAPSTASAYQTLQVDKLARMFRETYHYKVQNVRLKATGVQLPQVQINKSLADFVHQEDGESTLLVVYYAGHGMPGQRHGNLELTGKRSPTIDQPASVVWNHAEFSLHHTLADIFEIFDCCYAGDLGRGSRGGAFGTRSFEYLGATSSGKTTKAPGPGSFSSALIWALGVLAKESGGFTTNTLANKIREAPNFPKKQVPILTERNELSSLQRIVIHPLPDGNEASTTAPAEDQDMTSQQPWGFLDLKISLEQCPTKQEIGKFGKDIAMMMQSTELKVRRVKWGGLYRSMSTGGLHSPMLDNRFDVNEKVWMMDPATNLFTWIMYVVDKRYDDKKPGWEYKLKYEDNKESFLPIESLGVSHWQGCKLEWATGKNEQVHCTQEFVPRALSTPQVPKLTPIVEDCPNGYPKVAGFMDSEDTFGIYRRFGFLYSRVLLSKQDELRRLEDDLDAMDHRDAHDTDYTRKCLKSCAKDFAREQKEKLQTRKELLQTVRSKLYDYGQFLLQAQQMVSLNKPADRDHLSVQNFLESGYEDNGKSLMPLMEGDNEFIYRKEDLITLRPGRESAWLDAFVERVLKLIHCKPVQETRLKSSSPHIQYYTKSRVDRLVTLIISGIMLILLVVPTYALYRVTNIKGSSTTNATCIGILLVATLVFSAVLSLFTKAKRHEILGASAAYCAVLVVFIGNVNGGKGGLSSL
ncbi:MAG: hypothetical protein Q9180_002845 [Flavoplaca navasiana]